MDHSIESIDHHFFFSSTPITKVSVRTMADVDAELALLQQ